MKILLLGCLVALAWSAEQDLETFRNQALEQHNLYRTRHQVPSAERDSAAEGVAQAWAENLASTGQFAHNADRQGFGENIYMSSGSADGKSAVDAWYNEVTKPGYDFNNQGFSSGTGHFTQVVWKASTGIGCGKASSSSGATYVVCNYNPAGNMMGDFENNVFPASDNPSTEVPAATETTTEGTTGEESTTGMEVTTEGETGATDETTTGGEESTTGMEMTSEGVTGVTDEITTGGEESTTGMETTTEGETGGTEETTTGGEESTTGAETTAAGTDETTSGVETTDGETTTAEMETTTAEMMTTPEPCPRGKAGRKCRKQRRKALKKARKALKKAMKKARKERKKGKKSSSSSSDSDE